MKRFHPAAWFVLLGLAALAAVALATLAPRLASATPGDSGQPSGVYFEPERLISRCDGEDAVRIRARITDQNGRPVRDGTTVSAGAGDGVFGVAEAEHGTVIPRSTTTRSGYAEFSLIVSSEFNAEPAATLYAGDISATIVLQCGEPETGTSPPSGGRSGEATAVQISLDDPYIICDGEDTGRMTVRFYDHNRRPVADGTPVRFTTKSQGGVIVFEPEETTTHRGAVSTQFAIQAPEGPLRVFNTTLFAEGAGLQAAITPRCARGPLCDLPDTPGHPCHTYTPTSTGTPAPPRPTPTITLTPTITPTPTFGECASGQPPAADPAFRMYVEASEEGGLITATMGVENLAATSYQAAQWYLCYDGALLDVLSIERVPGAPLDCASKADSGVRVLAGCLHYGGPFITYSGDVWVVRFTCLEAGLANLALRLGSSETFISDGEANQPVTASGAPATCSGTGPATPTITPTRTPTATRTPTFTGTPTPAVPCAPPSSPDPLYELYVHAEESGGLVTAVVGLNDLGGGTYTVAQWNVCRDGARLAPVAVRRVEGASEYCQHASIWSQLMSCAHAINALNYFGDAFILEFRCLASGETRIGFEGETFAVREGIEVPTLLTTSTINCTAIGPTPTPTATRTASPTPAP